MNGIVAPICCCSYLLGNLDPATLRNVGNYLPTNKLPHPKIIFNLTLHSLLPADHSMTQNKFCIWCDVLK